MLWYYLITVACDGDDSVVAVADGGVGDAADGGGADGDAVAVAVDHDD